MSTSTIRTELRIRGMTCGSCVDKVRRRLTEHPQVAEATVSLQPPRAVLEMREPVQLSDLNVWLAAAGAFTLTEEPADAAAPAAAESEAGSAVLPAPSAATYRPLIILLGYLLLVPAAVLAATGWDAERAMQLFMGGFFLAFSFFKMLDIPAFSRAYQGYDLVAAAVPVYGSVYPFLELGLGLAYVAGWQPFAVNVFTAVLMGVSLIGVLRAVRSKKRIRCACLGTVFQLPMSTVTIVEDGLMLAMALVMLAM